jgi:hypothetical protein
MGGKSNDIGEFSIYGGFYPCTQGGYQSRVGLTRCIVAVILFGITSFFGN